MTIDLFAMMQGSHPSGQWLVFIGFLLAAFGAIVAAAGLLIALKSCPKKSDVSLVPQTTNIYNVYTGNPHSLAEPALPPTVDLLKILFKSVPDRKTPEPEPPDVNQ